MSTPASGAAGARAPRAHFVDLARLVMSVQMIQGHAIDALLEPAAREGTAFEVWTWLRGLTAVGFLVAAGLSFHLSSLARWDSYRADAPARARRVKRALMLIAIGYLLHAPAGVLSGNAALAAAALRDAQIVDVLQCIGVTMLLLEAIASRARRASQVVGACAALAFVAIAGAPVAAQIECGDAGALRFLCNYASRSGGSLFPLAPWGGFVLLGVVVGAIALPRGATTDGRRTAGRLALLSGVLVFASFVVDAIEIGAVAPELYWASPAFSALRAGAVVALCALLAAASAKVVALPSLLRTLATQTLFLYVSHLLTLYVAGVGLARVVGPTLSPASAVGVAVLMIVACSLGALAWAPRPMS